MAKSTKKSSPAKAPATVSRPKPKVTITTPAKAFQQATSEARTYGTLIQKQVGKKIVQSFESSKYDPLTNKEVITKVELPPITAPKK
jgi:hypothetical protein